MIGPEWLPPFRLQNAYFSSCQMGPQFPAWLERLGDIDKIDISTTGITDHFPHWFSTAFSKATYLDISYNQISGGLPKKLYLRSNQITGQIPKLPRNLTILDVSENSLSGPLQSNFGALNLEHMLLSSNNFSGHIPGSICELQKLKGLDLANNFLEGEFPQCYGMTRAIF